MNRRTLLRAGAVVAADAWLAEPLRALAPGTMGAPAHESAPDQVAPIGPNQIALNQIGLNQVGYRLAGRKVATLAWRSPQPPPAMQFRVASVPANETVFAGDLSPAKLDPLSGDTVFLADFSEVKVPGRYVIEIAGVQSEAFTIGPDVYREALRLTMRSYYGQRCGCGVDLGGGYAHPPCHRAGAFGASSGRSGKLKNRGGWHDAGDYGRYIVNSAITTGTLLWAWELYADTLQGLKLDLPESGRKLPDYLAEVRWNLRWMLTMQDRRDGGVWHKQTSAQFCGFVMPQDDAMVSEVIGTGSEPYKSTAATAGFAAVMAIAARCYKPYSRHFASLCEKAAERAFAWCEQHPEVAFRNPAGVSTGEYGDRGAFDKRLWAAAELWRTTQGERYRQWIETNVVPGIQSLRIVAPTWGNTTALGLWACVLGKFPNAKLEAAIAGATNDAAWILFRQHDEGGYGTTLAGNEFFWGSNAVAANQSLLLLMAERLNGVTDFRETAFANLHYLLGRNCFGVSWVTQVGSRPFQHPHHRPSAADKIDAPWPGLLSGGPNAHGGDSVANALPKGPPMRHWVDDVRAYALNEVAINWNAPLVFLLAAAQTVPPELPLVQ